MKTHLSGEPFITPDFKTLQCSGEGMPVKMQS